jgi:alkanesulfonate monooxygenase SsuD/methylene tetrahydromethanopterin reductase-like flavin-dependent oxidoreductase (luciferase family)
MPEALPALNLVAAPGQRRATLEIAQEIERRGFAGISISSQYSNTAQCVGLAFATERIPFATAIAPIYAQTVDEFANTAAYIHEVSRGRFQFGIGVAHAPTHQRMGVAPGKPLADIRAFVAKYKSCEGIGELPPIILAALRKRMVALAAEIADGLVFANAAVSHTRASLPVLPAAKRDDLGFFIGNRIRTCISDDEAEAKAVLRRTVTNYALMPNYRNYWKEAGYVEEMEAIERTLAEGDSTRFRDISRIAGSRTLHCSDRPRRSARVSINGGPPASAHRYWCRSPPMATRRRPSRGCSLRSPTEPGVSPGRCHRQAAELLLQQIEVDGFA